MAAFNSIWTEPSVREWVSINGRLMPAEEARVSVFDAGFMQGIGLFETMRAYDGHVFRLDRHLDRLANSARALGWSVIPDVEQVREDVLQAASAAEQDDVRVRLTVTTGSLRQGSPDTPALTVVASAAAGAQYPDECYLHGVTVVVSPYRQSRHDPTAGHKTTSYFARLAALRLAYAESAFEALWLTPDDQVAEGAISSVFVARDGLLLTPPLETPILPGITRATVLELAAALDIPAQEIELTLDDVIGADEVFLTNSLMEIVPVVRVGRDVIAREKPGELTRRLAVAYTELVNQECCHG